MKTERMKRMTAIMSAAAVALAALPGGTAVLAAAENEVPAPDLNRKITFAGSENYGGPLDDAFKAVARTRDGGYVAVGYSMAKSEDPVWGHVPSANSYAYDDGLVVKFNEEMGVEWAQNYGRSSTDVLFDVDVLENGTIVAAGQTFLSEQVGNAKNASGWVLMIDPDDPSLYKEVFPGGSKGDYLQAVCAMEDNEFVVLGYSASSDAGDYINGMIITDEGHLVGVGESTSESNNPVYGNNGKNDATVFATFAFGSSEQMTDDSENVVWADGLYEDSANGYHGPITVSVAVENHAIASVTEIAQSETSSYYKKAKAVYASIEEANTWDVDSVSGATLSSNGIKKAVKRALSQAAAATVRDMITDAVWPSYDEIKAAAARAAYEELGTYARTYVTNFDALGSGASEEPALVGTAGYDTEVEAEDMGAPYEHRVIGFEDEEELPEADEDGFFEEETAEETSGGPLSAAELSDTYYPFQKAYFDAVGVPTFRERKLGGRGVTLAVIDSGFSPAHEDINYENVLPATDCTGGTAVDGGMTDTNKHGTGVLGELIAIRDNGIGVAGLLDEVKIAPIKVNAKKNVTADLEAAVYAAVDRYNASVITMSLGNTTFGTESFREAIEYAASKNVIIVAAAGNDGNSDPVYPAAFDNVIGVGYVDSNLVIAEKSQINESVDVTAPGVGIYTTYPSMRTHCTISGGTSFAAPMVAAMAAAAKQMNPEITHDEFLELLKETSTDRGEEGYDTTYGNGVVNFDAFAKKITFSDVLDPEAWFYDSVYWAYNKGITSGYGEGTFKPFADLTRAQTVGFLYKLAGSPDTGDALPAFSDVPEGSWYENAVKWAVENEITHGYGSGTFRPDAKCTRAMIVTFIANYAKYVGRNYEEPHEEASFTDVGDGDWFKDSVDWATANGITSGYGAGTFRPGLICSRAMMAAFLRNYAAIGAEERGGFRFKNKRRAPDSGHPLFFTKN